MSARFDGHEVAIKIHAYQNKFDQEITGYRAVNAMDDPKIESKGIPKIYYTGTIFGRHPVIVMTLFDETLEDRYLKQNESFSAYSILEVLLQVAKTLAYLQNRGVVHNDIKPGNIFLRDSEVFLGDFDCFTFKGRITTHGTFMYGSSGFHTRTQNPQIPCAYVDDLESLVYMIWRLEHIHYNEPSGGLISEGINNERFVMEQCEHFKNFPRSYKAMEFICLHEMLSGKADLDYDGIVDRLIVALDEVKRNTRQTKFEWLGSSSSAASVTFGYSGENKPNGKQLRPKWIKRRRRYY